MINPFRRKFLIDRQKKEVDGASRRGFIRKAIAGVFGAVVLASAGELSAMKSRTGFLYVKRDGEVINNYEPQGYEPYWGEIAMYAFGITPKNWAQCNGQLLQIKSNSAMFYLLGTTYGGDGVSTFALPDLRGRVPIHFGTGTNLNPVTLGQSGGAESIVLTVDQLPAHNHYVSAANYEAKEVSPAGNFFAMTESQSTYGAGYPDGQLNSNTVSITGGNAPVSLMNSFVCVQFCIAMQGLYPSRLC